jgi:hypothetical protein
MAITPGCTDRDSWAISESTPRLCVACDMNHADRGVKQYIHVYSCEIQQLHHLTSNL